MVKYNLHKIGFYEYAPLPIHSMAYCQKLKQVAITRCFDDSAFIEIWNISSKWFLEQTLLAVKSIEAIIWFNERLFSVGLDDLILEYNLTNGLVKKKLNSFNGPIWCACINENLRMIAAGTDSGTIVLFDVENELIFKHSLMKQEDPILSIAWHEESNTIVVGGKDIRIWNVNNLQMIQKIAVAKEAFIWALALSSDFTIVSGDSTGHTCFWIGRPGSLQYSKRFRSHESDIHSITFFPDNCSVHVGGVDCLMHFQLTSHHEDAPAAWVMTRKMNYHTNDIRSVIYVGNNSVASAGLDCNIIVNDLTTKNISKILPFPRLPIAHSIHAKLCVMLQYPRCLEIWKLGHTNQISDSSSVELSVDMKEELLLKINSGSALISCSAASSCGSFVAYSNHLSTFLYHLNLTKNKTKNTKFIEEIVNKFLNKFASTCLLFSSDAKYLVCAERSSLKIKVYEIRTNAINLKYVIPSSVFKRSSPITMMQLNSTVKYLAIADCHFGVHIYDIQNQKICWSLPSQNSSPLCLSFDPKKSNNIVIAYSDRMIIEADISEKAYTPWCRKAIKNIPTEWQQAKPNINRIFYNPNNNNEIFVQDAEGFYIFKKLEFLDEPLAKKDTVSSPTPSIIKNNIKHLMFLDVLDNNNIVTIERSPRDLLECLPPPFKRHKFGI